MEDVAGAGVGRWCSPVIAHDGTVVGRVFLAFQIVVAIENSRGGNLGDIEGKAKVFGIGSEAVVEDDPGVDIDGWCEPEASDDHPVGGSGFPDRVVRKLSISLLRLGVPAVVAVAPQKSAAVPRTKTESAIVRPKSFWSLIVLA